MRLKAADRKKKLQEVRDYENAATHDDKETRIYNFNWHMLRDDHFFDLRLKLKHIGELHILDVLKSDTLDEHNPRMKEYIKHYTDSYISTILNEIEDARQSMQWLENIMLTEKEERAARQTGKVISFPERAGK